MLWQSQNCFICVETKDIISQIFLGGFTQTFQIHLVLPHLAFWRILMSNFLHQLARVLFDWFHCWCLLSLCAYDKESSCWTWLTLVCAEIEERQYKQISVNGSIPLSPRHRQKATGCPILLEELLLLSGLLLNSFLTINRFSVI